jgi:hypothetical protein
VLHAEAVQGGQEAGDGRAGDNVAHISRCPLA